MGFEITKAESNNIIEETGHYPKRTISKSGNGYLYSIYDNITSNDIRCMETAKESFISYACSNVSATLPSFQIALEIAKSKLSGLAAPDKIDILSYLIAHDTVGYGPISILMEDKLNIEEIEINSPNSNVIIYSTKYGRCITNLRFSSEYSFRSAINRMIKDTEKEINENTPIIDAQVEDLRIHAQIRPYALSGATASIRLGGRKEIDLCYLLRNNTISSEILAYLWLALESKQNLIVSGAPASGKTTLLSALTPFIPSNDKVITVEEDVNEIKGNGAYNVIGLYGSRYNSVSPKEQVINSLRMRPNRIIVGEMRGEEAKDLFMGGNIGISFAATMHSNEGGMQILKKLMVRPMCVEARSLSTLDLAIYMKQTDISRRSISGIFEYKWLSRAEAEEGEPISDDDLVKILCIASNSQIDKALLKESKVITAYSRQRDISQKDAVKEFERRSKLIGQAFSEGKKVEESVIKYPGW